MLTFLRKEPVWAAAFAAALVSVFFIPPDGRLYAVSVRLAGRVKSARALGYLLIFFCYFASMLMTNDVALIALAPVTPAVLSLCGKARLAALVIVLQTLAANIGSSLTPIGNSQNLFLFMRYHFGLSNFFTAALLGAAGYIYGRCYLHPVYQQGNIV